ncbi:hypothetical protein C0075_08940 [Rhizobium sp. KAs_5_22]|uniref:FAD/NAD(P)-binding protein n=1 Tax=Ciceribacter selenitireducens TaxID=448181 RepID=UPI0004B8816F|nr:FAD/NAD(P)-binding protein [Ciceribacter selenitireducens]PPJ45840.1 hypothetical protein C0075_08940 [Rhizobium sp. KAs_5_22]
MNETIALIGSGPTAIYTLCGLLDSARPLTITIFEKEAVAGKGMPYHPAVNDRAMLANIASIEIPPIRETLVAWLHRQSDAELERLRVQRAAIGERAFYPRIVLGEYFKSQFDGLVAEGVARGHAIVVKAGHEISDIALGGDDIRLTVARQEEPPQHYAFGHVVMATGHSFADVTEVKPGYFASPWPASLLKTIPAGRVGILGTSLSAIDAMVTVATRHGSFYHDEAGLLEYQPASGSQDLRISLMSRKGMLPEADFYFAIPYEPLSICTDEAIDALVESGREDLLDAVFELFARELTACDPDYAAKLGLAHLTVETIGPAYFAERESQEPLVWAARNLAEAKQNYESRTTIAWRYAILRMHEVIAQVVPHLNADDLKRFHRHFKSLFVDNYATVPHASIERILALRRAGVLDIITLGPDYELDTETCECGAIVAWPEGRVQFDAFIDATGQGRLSASDIPFPSLLNQGVVGKAKVRTGGQIIMDGAVAEQEEVGGVGLDACYRLEFDQPLCNRLYCLALPFLLHQFPFIQGITSSAELGETVATAILVETREGLATPAGTLSDEPALALAAP